MEIEKYKMIYTKNINEELLDEMFMFFIDVKFKEEIRSDNDIRILGKNFVKNNKNKAKLVINNKKYKLKEFINNNDFANNEIKISILLNKDLIDISHMFENCVKLIEFSICDNITNIEDKEYSNIEEYNDYNFDYSENNKDDNNYFYPSDGSFTEIIRINE